MDCFQFYSSLKQGISSQSEDSDESMGEDEFPDYDFGAQFEGELVRCCKEHHSDANFTADVRALKERCHTFLMDLINEAEKRLPTNKDIFLGMS
ncbi:hypothetical protein Pmani_001798 [Petrolisthes manimaculis]|uniref:Uncharacterized protein n=1 Tax=Petrolisthes manimaculis TaxID=1843537 RepID=A0AAE1UP43_9EUCA|nr:hypothetical protein Pmani_001798 [Petrolisthes manimaculis]